MVNRARVLISYAHDPNGPGHAEMVRRLWEFLRSRGANARLDLPTPGQRQDWSPWMADEIRAADAMLVIASPRLPGARPEPEGVPHGVQWRHAGQGLVLAATHARPASSRWCCPARPRRCAGLPPTKLSGPCS